MRKSQSRNRSRLAIAGLSAGAVVAAVLVAPGAAFAATVPTPSVGPTGTTVTIVDSGTAFSGSTFAVELSVASCAANYVAPGTSVFAATGVVKNTSSSLSFTVPTTVTLGTNGVAKSYNVCVYVGSTAGSSAQVATSTVPVFNVTAVPTSGPLSGASGGGNTLTLTSPTTAAIFTGVTTPGVLFSTTSCALTSASTAATATKTSNTVATVTVPATVLGTGSTAAPYNVCIYDGVASNSNLLAATTYSVTLPSATLSSIIGPSGGGNGLTITSTSNFLTGVTSAGVAFTTAATCPTTYPAAATYVASPLTNGVVLAVANTVRKLANNRLAVTVPALPLIASAPTAYLACVYNGTTTGTSTILTAATYTSTTVQTVTGVTPNAGPALGGSTITITGADFPTAAGSITATLGGVALTGITPVSSTAFTAVTPAHSPENDVTLVVTTSAGSRTLQSAFSYNNALQITPNTAPNTMTAVNMDVLGTGFLSQTFGSATGNARVFLVDGMYNGATTATNTRSNGPVAECGSVLVISDSELVCTMQLNRRLAAVGTDAFTFAQFNSVTYTKTLTNGVTTVAGSKVINLAAGTFSANDVGQAISEASQLNLPTGATITAVLGSTRAVISAPATASGTAFTATVGATAVHTVTAVTTTSLSSTIVATSGTFSNADVGRVISGATGSGIADGTTITAVAADGLSATISAPVTTGAAGSALPLYPSAAVPNGAYSLTFVSNGNADAESTDTDYTQSVISSGSTFTVAPF